MWQEKVKPYVEAGELAVLGVVQEQHPDRARLYRQWRGIEWPILVDALNELELRVVPVPMGLDASGVVRRTRMKPDDLDAFMAAEYPETARPADEPAADGPPTPLEEHVEGFRERAEASPEDGRAWFRLGVALRRRSESPLAKPGDAQAAVECWQRALSLDPNQYIWRRRLQQYGPRLDKPYNFYFWVEKAREEIRARGEEPFPLSSEPAGSEVAPPADDAEPGAVEIPNPDPDARITRDERRLIVAEVVATPARVRPGDRVRVRIELRPSPIEMPWWNNESAGLVLSVAPPAGWTVTEGTFRYPQASEPETREPRILEFEIEVPDTAPAGPVRIPAYVLYDVCEDEAGICLRRRRDLEVPVVVDPEATPLR